MDIDEAVVKVGQGDLDAYRVIVAQCEEKVRVVLAVIVPEPAMVDDLVQEVFLRAYRLLGTYRVDTDFTAWIKEIARGVAHNERRAWGRHQVATRRYRVQVEMALDQQVEAASRLNTGESLSSVRDCMDQLADTARQVVERHYWQGMDAEGIASGMGRSLDWVWTVLHRARKALAQCLESKRLIYGSR
jgi:RNA polymerase sigma-70 factor (ECF subfamily)